LVKEHISAMMVIIKGRGTGERSQSNRIKSGLKDRVNKVIEKSSINTESGDRAEKLTEDQKIEERVSLLLKDDSSLDEASAKEIAKEKGLPLKEGIIATGDQFVANVERKNWISKIFDAHALEMEGASVAVVCNALDIPFFILRAISDSADMDAGFDFDEFLEGSAKVSADFILDMVEKIEQK
jgi:nucleoside phosphorylase